MAKNKPETEIHRPANGETAATAASATDASDSSSAGGITNISIRTYITAFVVLIALMVAALILTRVLPSGQFDRVLQDGSEVIVPGSYHAVAGNLPFWRWLLAPLLILGSANNFTLIMLLVFLFVIGGAFFALESCGVLRALIATVAHRFAHNRRILLFLIPLVFMLMGTLIGSFEEVIPLTPIVVALALSLGWDRLQGVAMSLLAVGCGFAVGVMNPFTTGIAQTIAGLPMFSGAWLRLISFALVYGLLMAFLLWNGRQAQRQNDGAAGQQDDGLGQGDRAAGTPVDSPADTFSAADPQLMRALRAFVIILLTGIVIIISLSVIPLAGLADLVFPVVALTFLLCGLVAPLRTGCGGRQLAAWFWQGVKAIAPGALLVLMASSISFMLTEGRVLDTILFYASNLLANTPSWLAILGIYLLVLIMEFAIPSGSAKAFLLMPLIAPLVGLLGISTQLAVVAYGFGDGFTNVFYPTNPALLIALSISGLSYGQWIKRTWPFLLALLLLTTGILIFGLVIGYS